MLKYLEIGQSYMEVPKESSLCIYISGCVQKCRNCQYPELQDLNTGDFLNENFSMMLDAYLPLVSCICFLGEGNEEEENRQEFIHFSRLAHARGLKTCLYSGRNVGIETWMECFDYIKLGSYNEEQGPLTAATTNQRFFQKNKNIYNDITFTFWENAKEFNDFSGT